MFAKMKEKLAGGAKRMQGRTDLLEAICAACALVAAADGDVDDAELEATVKAVTANENLRVAFKPNEIEACIDKMLQRASGGRVGRMNLMKELDDIPQDDGEMVLLSALDIAEADGNIDDDEMVVIEKIAGKFGLKASTYL
jgi:tellurite resistance protein TerB